MVNSPLIRPAGYLLGGGSFGVGFLLLSYKLGCPASQYLLETKV